MGWRPAAAAALAACSKLTSAAPITIADPCIWLHRPGGGKTLFRQIISALLAASAKSLTPDLSLHPLNSSCRCRCFYYRPAQCLSPTSSTSLASPESADSGRMPICPLRLRQIAYLSNIRPTSLVMTIDTLAFLHVSVLFFVAFTANFVLFSTSVDAIRGRLSGYHH